ncbi:MAG TPA: tRNA (adenosine(37)-N6)-dimethylallyltransferase MiaA [Candidatus Omnitrophota bacterium]|nr:tRNA (adenosine(37)-N6)-dimethylallyltransferase MiaA [Candidatus Omnitrophota bacterium]HPN88383.1 tRNA (adenosine(37)-N6)-dimethylallyltransferase MiaA [Candidatus Omnitrophota bacterium]
MALEKIIFILGPTAVGKTTVAYFLAQKIKGEIISCDSMQVYKEITIASNKPPDEILKKVPHHLINIVSVAESFDVARFNQLALEKIAQIHKKNHIPIIAGGSGLYAQILLDGIFEGRGENGALREELRSLVKAKGADVLYAMLKEKDKDAALKIHPHDVKKVIRALEVCLLEKQPISQLQKKRSGLWGKFDMYLFVLNRPREQLYAQIDRRVDEMFAQGVVQEVETLLKKNISLTAQGFIGFSEIKDYLKGNYDLAQARYLMKRNTRHYAKRQLTWFRKDKRMTWIDIENNVSYDDIACDIQKRIFG